MLTIVRIIGVFIVTIGIIVVLTPCFMKIMLSFMLQGRRIYFAGITRITAGIIFLITASQCRVVGIVIAYGILALLGGILIFALNIEKLKSILEWWNNRTSVIMRLSGVFVVGVGALLLYAA